MILKELDNLFGPGLEKIPEMTAAVELVREHPEVANLSLEAYRQMVGVMSTLSPADWARIAEVNKAYGKPPENLFVGKLGSERLVEVRDYLNSHFGGTNEDVLASNRLLEMMENAHKIREKDSSAKPNDVDEIWKDVIWGQTVVTDDRSKVQLAVGHFVSQLIFQKFDPKDGQKWEKDDFLSLTDMVAWIATKYPAYLPGELREMIFTWMLDKPENLGWVSEKRIEKTEEVMKNTRVE